MMQRFWVELWTVMQELSPSLLFGLVIAGAMHVFLPKGMVQQGLNRSDMKSVLRSVLIGVPLPLCSCGVIPTAIGLRKQGASKGATTAFLISTPQTGVDSLFVSAAFLGWPFAIFKVVAAFVTGLVGGLLANRLSGSTSEIERMVEVEVAHDPFDGNRFAEVFRYAVFDLLAMIDLWIILGIVVAATISTLIPLEFLSEVSWIQGIGGMLLVLLIAIPLYVCTTGSVPIAASLIAMGMPMGAALVFLMAGPATNVATIGAVYRGLGWRILMVYLGTVVTMSLVLGLSFDFVLGSVQQNTAGHSHESSWLGMVSSLVLSGLLIYLLTGRIARWLRKADLQIGGDDVEMILEVEGMTCPHCVANVKRALESIDEVVEAQPDLASGRVQISGQDLDSESLTKAVEIAGYRVKSCLVP